MKTFKGFSAGKTTLTPIPTAFFSELLPNIENIAELKLTLYVFWRLDRLSGSFRYLRQADIAQDELFMLGLASDLTKAEKTLNNALALAVERGTLLKVELELGEDRETLFFLNSPKGRAAVQAVRSGQWRPSVEGQVEVVLKPEPGYIFKLYEEHIGPLTPLIAEALAEADDLYPPSWIEEAFQIAIERKSRSWRYVEAILKRWQEERGHAQKDRRDPKKTGRKYIEGELSDFIKH